MAIRIPADIDRWCASAKEAVERKRASERADQAALDRIARENTDRWLRERPIRMDCAHTIFVWLLELERAGVRKNLAATGLETLNLLGPMTAWADSTNGHTGSYWVRLPLTGELGLVLGKRSHACVGREWTLSSVEALVDNVPTGICVRIAREIGSGEVWERVRNTLEEDAGR